MVEFKATAQNFRHKSKKMKRKHMRSSDKFSYAHTDICSDNEKLKRQVMARRGVRRRKSFKSAKNGAYSYFLCSMWMKILSLTVAFNFQTVRKFKNQIWIQVPKCTSKLCALKSCLSVKRGPYLKNSAEESAKCASSACGGEIVAKSSFRNLPLDKIFKIFKNFPLFSLPPSVFSLKSYKKIGSGAYRLKFAKFDKSVPEEFLDQDFKITYYRYIPWNSFSRAWGWINNLNLPKWARKPFLGWYVNKFGCDITEAEVDDLSSYKNLGDFFRRGLKTGVRPICSSSKIVSPADGTVLHSSPLLNGMIEQVKGVSFSLPTFLGAPTWSFNGKISKNLNENEYLCRESYESLLKKNSDSWLYYSVIYLSPGDYHRFHSPADWTVNMRRHFRGELLSVSPILANYIGGLFNLNERASLIGSWEHGFFSMTAVGATNVGSINFYKDQDLRTNVWTKKGVNLKNDFVFEEPLNFRKGEPVGEFNLGSTIVLIYEAPPNMDFNFMDGTRIKIGQGLF